MTTLLRDTSATLRTKKRIRSKEHASRLGRQVLTYPEACPSRRPFDEKVTLRIDRCWK